MLLVLGGLVLVCGSVLLLESLDSACGIDEFLLAGVEWMAHRADFGVYFFCGASGLEGISATASDGNRVVFRMYVFFHNVVLRIFETVYYTMFFLIFNRKVARLGRFFGY